MTVTEMFPQAKPESTDVAPRYLAYRYELPKPAGGQALTRWQIEEQLSLAHDTGCSVSTFGALATVPAEDLEELYDLADAVHDAEQQCGTQRFYDAVDDYADCLFRLAKLVAVSS